MADPKLYIIATPLGNRNDITLRAIEVLKSLNWLFAEDTRELRKLLDLYSIAPGEKRYFSYAKHNLKASTEKALECLREGNDIGLVSDRGTPGISDPGAQLVRAARAEGFTVIPVPGVSSVTTLMSVSGLDSDRFQFLGFLPQTVKERSQLFERVEKSESPFCIFESPQRILATLRELAERFPAGRVILGRELTKMFETISEFALAELGSFEIPEKGEFTLIVDPVKAAVAADEWVRELELRTASDRDWSKAVAARYAIPASEAYNALQQRKHNAAPK